MKPASYAPAAAGLLIAALVGATAAPRVAEAALETVASYEMNEPANATVLSDSGAFGLDGAIGTSVGTDVVTGITYAGATGYRWPYAAPDTSPHRPQRLAVVPHDDLLDPGTEEFAVEIRYRTDHQDGNIVQKGQSQTEGGYWKLEQNNGIPTCLFRRTLSNQAAVAGPKSLADGSWHTVRCVRSDDDVRMFVDGAQVDRRNVSVGQISNGFDLTIGGKIACNQKSVGCDYFSGDIDYVRIEKDVPEVPNQPPTVAIGTDCTGLTCTFDGSGSTDPDGVIVEREWDLDDGTAVEGQASEVEHTFPEPGSYNVTLTVTDDDDATAGDTKTVTVGEPISKFVPTAPQRLFDTRPDETPAGYKGVVRGGTSRSVQVAGRAGIPESGVTAVAINLTAIGAEAPGYVTASPTPLTEATTSSLNISSVGQVRANLVIVPVSSDGTISLFTLRDAHLVGDVTGYFRPQSGASDDGRILSQRPQRLFDTRVDSILGPPLPVAPGGSVSAEVLGRAGVPEANVSAVVLNVTATDPDGPGFVTVWPDGSQPATSSLNVNASGETVANQVIVPVGADGRVRFASTVGVDLVADVLGWVTADGAARQTSGLFVPVQPARVFDTRTDEPTPGPKGLLSDDATISPQISGVAGVPPGAASVVLNVTLVGTGPGYATLWPTGSSRPETSNVNVDHDGDIRPNGAFVRLGTDGRIDVYVLTRAHVLADVAGYLLS